MNLNENVSFLFILGLNAVSHFGYREELFNKICDEKKELGQEKFLIDIVIRYFDVRCKYLVM